MRYQFALYFVRT